MARGILIVLFGFILLLTVCWRRNPAWEVEHPVEISASPAIVWNLLVDLENYSKWNQYSPKVDGKLEVGEVVWVESHLAKERK